MIKKLSTRIIPDPRRVVLRFLQLSEVRTKRVIQMVLLLREVEVKNIQGKMFAEFSKRHRSFDEILFSDYLRVEKYILVIELLGNDRKLLLVAYLSKEYLISFAALFNSSMLLHPDQTKLDKDIF